MKAKQVFFSLIFVIFLLMVSFSVYAQKPKLKEFMIVAMYGGVELTEKNVKTFADADFNTVYGGVDKIELFRKYGLKLMIPHPGSAVAASLQGNKTVMCYFVGKSEPISLKDLHTSADSVKAYRKADPTHPAFVNMNQKGGNWLKYYIDLVDPDFISYTCYQWWYGGIYEWFTGENNHFIKLEQFRDESMRANLPFIQAIEVNALRNIQNNKPPEERNFVPPPDNIEKIRQSVYTSLAYGMKGLRWFYSHLLFDPETGEYNETGRQIAEINSELKHIGPILFDLESIDVFHSVPAPRGSRATTPDNWVQPLGKELVMGTFRDGKNEMDYILVANKDIKKEQKVKLQFRLFLQEISSVEMINKKTGEWRPLEIKIQEDKRDHDYIYNVDNIPERMKDYITYPYKHLTPESRQSLSFFELYHTFRPPYQYVEFTLAKGDGELLRVKLVEGEDIADPR